MTQIRINQQDFNDLAWSSMRYALGRKTYITGVISNLLIRNVDKIFPDVRYRIGEEIAIAINLGHAGMEMDVKEWKKVLKAFSEIPA